MGIKRIRFTSESQYVAPNIDPEELEITLTPDVFKDVSNILFRSDIEGIEGVAAESKEVTGISAVVEEGISSADKGDDELGGTKWKSWTISMDLDNIEKLSEGIGWTVETLDSIVKVLLVLMKIMRLFTRGKPSLTAALKFAIDQFVKEIKKFIESLTTAGLYVSLIAPPFDKKDSRYSLPINGGYQEFISRVNSTCLHSEDPYAPKFEGENDVVGGAVIAMLGGVSDPEYLNDMVDNFKKLGKIFGNIRTPNFGAPEQFKATAGFFSTEKGFSKLRKGPEYRIGIKLTWKREDELGPAPKKYLVYKTDTLSETKGEIKTVDIDGDSVDLRVPVGDPIEIRAPRIRRRYTYIDYNIEEGKTYYYKVYSVPEEDHKKYFKDNPEFESISSPIATSRYLSVTSPRECIPVEELEQNIIIASNGELLSPLAIGSDWTSVNTKKMLGKPMDGILEGIDRLAEKLQGMIKTGDMAFNDYLKAYENKIQVYVDIIQEIRKVVARIQAFSLRGTFMVMTLPGETGGMRGFVRRFNEGCSFGSADASSTDDDLEEGESPGVFRAAKDSPISRYREEGIMFGLILLYGYPSISRKQFDFSGGIEIMQEASVNVKTSTISLGDDLSGAWERDMGGAVGDLRGQFRKGEVEEGEDSFIQKFLEFLNLA